MIKCPDYNKEVSRSAYKCLHCGATLRKPERTFIGKIVLWIFVIFNLWIIIKMANIMTYDFQTELGQGMAFWIVAFQWAIGMIVLGIATLFTRPKER